MMQYRIYSNLVLGILCIASVYGFLIEENVLPINGSFLSLVLDALVLLVGVIGFQNNSHNRKLFFIISLFLLTTVFSFVLNSDDSNFVMYLNGIREFIPYFLFPIIFINIHKSKQRFYFLKIMNKFLYVFLSIQIPVAIYQYLKYGAGDKVGGTLGEGFSGVLTFIIMITTFYLLLNKISSSNDKRVLKYGYIFIFWLPIFINETKIAFFLIIIFTFLLFKFSFFNLFRNLSIGLGMVFLLISYDYYYNATNNVSFSKSILDQKFIEHYLAGEENEADIPRFTKIAITYSMFDDYEIFLGKGVGQFKGGNNLSLTNFATNYDWLLRGSRPMLFFIMVQVGVIGVIIFIFYWFYLAYGNRNGLFENNKKVVIFSSICFLILQFYNDSLRSLFVSAIFLFVLTTVENRKKKLYLRDKNQIVKIVYYNKG